MPPRGPQIPLLKRAAILTLHWHAEKSWIEISTILRVHPDTARKICIRAKERATDPNDFDDVLLHLEDAERPGRPPKNTKEGEMEGVEKEDEVVESSEVGIKSTGESDKLVQVE
ncbi:uncharacterized protein LAJ45_11002 [Morchella importuna]|uniref:Uncharacterized protein n=1 Tax=Morchella conica CCBAS932 TaxID=1392247 RepID=A0A3N4L3X7_9PEZI|nr:uncharacterized protein LAJ45_11002 [Morchella importuna]KAH8144982.1 hypothetical protein LAJ45_11002 [Morchella importuna]RPB15341.1 hypothetical protein P167DRAFT_603262 [Morchella conica CCBAS932]